MTEKLFCFNCGKDFLDEEIVEESSAVLSVVKMIGRAILLIINLVLLGLPIMRRKKSVVRKKKKCDYCDSDLIFPDTIQNREFAESLSNKN